jgi:MerR family transcriptional regulator, light-induced transcriptional regulator
LYSARNRYKQAEEEMAADRAEHPYKTQIQDLLTAVHDLDAERCNFLLDLYFSEESDINFPQSR